MWFVKWLSFFLFIKFLRNYVLLQPVELDVAEHEGILKPDGFVKIQMDSRAFGHLLREEGIILRGKGGDDSYTQQMFKDKRIGIVMY